jgi:hypothetical protein
MCDDLDDRVVGPETARVVEEDAGDSGMGCDGIRNLAGEFRTAQHPMARQRLFAA